MDLADIRQDLIDEQQALDDIVAPLDDDQWAKDTPSPRWTVADQIAHLTYFDATATLAISDPNAFSDLVTALMEAPDPEAVDDLTLSSYRAMEPSELLDRWRSSRIRLADAAGTLSAEDRVIWYGPSMGAKSFLTARLMETWAHGQDVADTLGVDRPVTDRLRHIAQLGFITRNWSYRVRGLEAPSRPVVVRLDAPSGGIWTFGPDDAVESISGPAVDFCQVVTQRRHIDDTGLDVDGAAARDWMERAQAFAGAATDGPTPGTWA